MDGSGVNGSINILQFDNFQKFLMIWFITNSSRVPFHCVSFLLGMLLCQWYVEFRLFAVVHVHRDPSMQIWNRQPSLWQLFKGRGTLKPFPFQQFFLLSLFRQGKTKFAVLKRYFFCRNDYTKRFWVQPQKTLHTKQIVPCARTTETFSFNLLHHQRLNSWSYCTWVEVNGFEGYIKSC